MMRLTGWLILSGWLWGSQGGQAQPARDGGSPLAAPRPDAKAGRELALKYCSTCHLFPEPETLTKIAWAHQIQPEMAKWLGLDPVDYEGLPDGKQLQEAAIFPSAPLLTEEEWFAIWDYYRSAAPSRLPSPPPRPAPAVGLKQFQVRKINHHSGVPMTSLLKIDSPRKRLFAGDAFGGALFVLNPGGEVTGRTRLASAPISVTVSEQGIYLTLIGRFFPSDALEGAVVLLAGNTAPEPVRPLVEDLRRPTDTVVADLNQDGRDDLVICSFGHRLGRFSWFAGGAGGNYEEQVLLDRAGAVRADVRDFNGDGRPDIMVMTAQAREGLYLFLNEGKGRFRMETVLEQPPTWGLAGFDLADFNKDGHPDLVVANGDLGDFALPMKPYHGLRIYLNDGTNHFREVFFYPMHGAYKAVARDFDGDGDLDLAAIAFYPDYAREQPASFVYLENRGGWSFEASTCAEQNNGRWLVMDAGDLDGDGDEDIVLGSFVRGPTTVPIPAALREAWRRQGAALLLLENRRR